MASTSDRKLLEKAMTNIGLEFTPIPVLREGDKIPGYAVVITNPEDVVELMRRTRDIDDTEISPHPDSNSLFIVYINS